jgi:uncharacterized protein
MVVVWCLFFGTPAQAASFDCGKATTNVEKLICENPKLSDLDEHMAWFYKEALKKTSFPEKLKQAQLAWLKKRNKCQDSDCINLSYQTQFEHIDAATMAPSPLAPFVFTNDESLTEQSYIGQRENPVCIDFKSYLNHPRSNQLFNPDGTLVRETEQFKSVKWEPLDKEAYRDAYNANFAKDGTHPNLRAEYLQRYADPEWVLLRTVVHQHERHPDLQTPGSEQWLYRLVQMRPFTRDINNPASKVELPAWFHAESVDWIGDSRGLLFYVDDNSGLLGKGIQEWITYKGVTYAVSNSTSHHRATPEFLSLCIHELTGDYSMSRSFLHLTCEYRAKHNE